MTDSGESSELMGIQEVADLLGVTHRTLRFYEDQGLIEPRRVGTMRIYGRREVGRMQVILRGKRLGFSIREIRDYMALYNTDPDNAEQNAVLVAKARERLAALATQKQALDEAMAELRAIEAEASAHLKRLGRA
jgi:DNA-binding transcriptional MerR regulator